MEMGQVSLENVVIIVQLLINFLMLATLVLAIKSLRETRADRAATILVWATDQIEAIKPQIKFVHSCSADQEDTEEFREAARKASAVYGHIAYMVRCGMIKSTHIETMLGGSFIALWDRLEGYVHELRAENGEPVTPEEGAFSRLDFEILAKKYRTRSNIPFQGLG